MIRIADILPYGHENALSLRELVGMTGENPRTIRREVEAERRRGTPILSDNRNGYWLALDSRETDLFVRSMRGRAREILRTAAAVERTGGMAQETVEGWQE